MQSGGPADTDSHGGSWATRGTRIAKTRWLAAVAAVALGIGAGAASALADTPAAFVSATIQGEAVVGTTLTVDVVATADPLPTTASYQWGQCDAAGNPCTPIPGATLSSYLISSADLGFTLIVHVSVA